MAVSVLERSPVLQLTLGFCDVWPGMKLSAIHNGEQILVRVQLGGVEPVREIFSRIDPDNTDISKEEVVFDKDLSFIPQDVFTKDNLFPGRYAVFVNGKAVRYKGEGIGKHAVASVSEKGEITYLDTRFDLRDKQFIPPEGTVYIKLEDEWEIETHKHWFPELY